MTRRGARLGFTMVPNDVLMLLKQKVVSWPDLVLLIVLLYMCWRDGGSTTITVKGFTMEFLWPWSGQTLRNSLKKLSSLGLIETSSPGKGRKHNQWPIELGDAWDFDSQGRPRSLAESWLRSVGMVVGAIQSSDGTGHPDEDPHAHEEEKTLGSQMRSSRVDASTLEAISPELRAVYAP